MPTDQEIKGRFWSELKDSPFIMLGVEQGMDGHAQPMTAHFEGEQGPIWFYASRQSDLVKQLEMPRRAMAHFVGKGHDLFATMHGDLAIEQDRSVIDRFWSNKVSLWYENGKDDPDLEMLRLDAEHAKIWNASGGLFVALKAAFSGVRAVAADNVAEVPI
jgi:general stress protein 26